MTATIVCALMLMLFSAGPWSGIAAGGDVNVDTPTVVAAPPATEAMAVSPPVIAEKPRVLLVPGTKVYTAPKVPFDVFMFDGKYWSHHHHDWFFTGGVGEPWTRLAIETVPMELRRLPARYYKVPPRCASGPGRQGRC